MFEGIINFLFSLPDRLELPDTVALLNPYHDEEVRSICREFYSRYYCDAGPRIFILGINPGRFGSGQTGISFTDPIRLGQLGIASSLPKKQELSSVLVYRLVERMGGAMSFYSKFYINSVCPLGFTWQGKNLNYYDIPALYRQVEPFIVASIHKQKDLGMSGRVAICLGEGKNLKALDVLNGKEGFFDTILPLPHPRYIMQYRLREVEAILDRMQQILEQALFLAR